MYIVKKRYFTCEQCQYYLYFMQAASKVMLESDYRTTIGTNIRRDIRLTWNMNISNISHQDSKKTTVPEWKGYTDAKWCAPKCTKMYQGRCNKTGTAVALWRCCGETQPSLYLSAQT